MARYSSEDVLNQVPEFCDVNLFETDRVLSSALDREGGDCDRVALTKFAQMAGSAQAQDWARLANVHTPLLHTHDARGRRIDRVEYHPAYHAIMDVSCKAGLHRLSGGTRPHVTRSALLYLAIQMEAGHVCPLTMTNAAVPVLARQSNAGAPWIAKIGVNAYDPRFIEYGQKTSVTIGMGMTEKQGGTDVRANTTRAVPVSRGGPGQMYEITGHKWFMSAPMSDAFLVLAQAPGGLTCFLMPRILPDGGVNGLRFQRLKSKLGNRSNASSEVEFDEAKGFAIGAEGEGTKVIIEMVTETRLDCAVASAGLMRSALAHAMHHAAHRSVFQKKLIDQPLMRHVLAGMALDAEAAVALVFRLARAFDASDPREIAWKRLMTPAVKYWVCKTAPELAAEAMECLGGNGYVEDGPLARLYREVPVNSIWEGSGNVMALDVVRVLTRERETASLVLEDLERSAQTDARLAAAYRQLEQHLVSGLEFRAREIASLLALISAGCLLAETAPPSVVEAFIAAKFSGSLGAGYGTMVHDGHVAAILARAAPATP